MGPHTLGIIGLCAMHDTTAVKMVKGMGIVRIGVIGLSEIIILQVCFVE